MHEVSIGARTAHALLSGPRDRRLHPRVADQIDVTIYAMGLPGPVEGRTRDIGPEGLCVETESPVGLEGARRVVLHLEDGDPSLKVSCCWQGNAPGREGVLNGLRFVDLEVAHTEVLWGIVFQRAREVASFLTGRSDLRGIPFDDALDVAMHTRLVRFAPGDWIYRQGSREARGDSAYLVLKGRVVLEATNERVESVYLDHVDAGGFFGGLPMLAPVPHPETAAAEGACELLEIDRFSYQYLLTDRPSAGYAISRALMWRYAGRLSSLIASAPSIPRDPFHRFVSVHEANGAEADTHTTGFSAD